MIWPPGREAEEQPRQSALEIYAWFTEGFDTPALNETKALLDELSDKSSATRRFNKSSKGR